jgi:hypothetical protein
MIFREIVVPMEASIPAKFYWFTATRFLRVDIQSCQKTNFLGTSCLRKSGITSALIEVQSSFYANFKANKMPFPVNYHTIYSAQVYFQGLQILPLTLYFSKCGILIFLKNILCACNYYLKTSGNIKLGLQWDWVL